MTFDVAAEAYDRFMGRYSGPLARTFADFAGVGAGSGLRVLDVGCGPGALTAELARRVGAGSVAAVDPSEPFVAAAAARNPGVDVRHATAEQLPFADASFDAAVAQLVVHFMQDPGAGLREMGRVCRPDGTVAACVWDLAGQQSPLEPFWSAARELDPEVRDESALAGTREGHLAELFGAAGLVDVESGAVEVTVEHPTFEEWWAPFTAGVGPAGAYAASLDEVRAAALRDRCRAALGDGPFTIRAVAWAARGARSARRTPDRAQEPASGRG